MLAGKRLCSPQVVREAPADRAGRAAVEHNGHPDAGGRNAGGRNDIGRDGGHDDGGHDDGDRNDGGRNDGDRNDGDRNAGGRNDGGCNDGEWAPARAARGAGAPPLPEGRPSPGHPPAGASTDAARR